MPLLATRHSPLATQRGVTYVELIISIVIISISVAAVIGAIGHMTGHSADPMIEHQAVAIAESYLEEILPKAYLDPDTTSVCPANGGNRSLYDNICDYNGLNDNGARDQNGTAITALGGYTISVSVNPSTSLNGLPSAQVLRVAVHVTHPSLVDITLSAYRTNY